MCRGSKRPTHAALPHCGSGIAGHSLKLRRSIAALSSCPGTGSNKASPPPPVRPDLLHLSQSWPRRDCHSSPSGLLPHVSSPTSSASNSVFSIGPRARVQFASCCCLRSRIDRRYRPDRTPRARLCAVRSRTCVRRTVHSVIWISSAVWHCRQVIQVRCCSLNLPLISCPTAPVNADPVLTCSGLAETRRTSSVSRPPPPAVYPFAASSADPDS